MPRGGDPGPGPDCPAERLCTDLTPTMAGLLDAVAEADVALYPTVAFPLSQWIISATAFQGVLIEQMERSCQAAADRQATLPPLLKILGDRSKFQILCVLRQGGKYNSELAEELGLTPHVHPFGQPVGYRGEAGSQATLPAQPGGGGEGGHRVGLGVWVGGYVLIGRERPRGGAAPIVYFCCCSHRLV